MNSQYRSHPQTTFNFNELVVDNFAGGGGASTGIEQALGRSVDIAINHDPDAIRMHETNHPQTRHYCESVWDVNPREVTNGQPVALAWFSPDCKHFSKAKGKTPVNKNIRGLAWVAVRWAATVRPRIIMLENVEEFVTWGPIKNGKPDPEHKGRTFNSFINALKTHGYRVEWKNLIASDFGAPTSRKRFFLIARSDNQPITWPKPTHGNPQSHKVKQGQLRPWRTAADIIDWSIPCPSIFTRKKPLAENTLKRIAKGIQRFVIDEPNPFTIDLDTKKTKKGSPFITEFANASNQRNMHAAEPIRTLCASIKGGHFALVSTFIEKYISDAQQAEPGTLGSKQITTSHLIKMRNNCYGSSLNQPAPTITAGGTHIGEVRAFLLKYYGNEKSGSSLNSPLHTVTTRERFGLIMIKGEPYQIVDIGLRMLQPHELYAASSFPKDYIITHDHSGARVTKTAQIARVGNAVPPAIAKALVSANLNQPNQTAIAA